MSDSKSLLVMSTLGVGDVLLAQPLFHAIRESSAFSRVCVIAREGPPAALVRRFEVADEIREYTSGAKNRILHAFEIGGWIRSRGFDAVITTTGMNPYYTAIMAILSGARLRVGERRGRLKWVWTESVPVEEHSHVVVRNRNLGHAIGVDAALIPRLTVDDDELRRARSMIPETGLPIAVIPGSNIELSHKRWPIENFRILVRELINHGLHPIILGGPDEKSLGKMIASDVSADTLTDLVGKTDLGTAGAILSLCSLAVGNDCMLMHFAAAVGTRTIALFGPSDPAVYRPMGEGHVVIQSPEPCAPCYHLDTRGCINPRCMTILSPHYVIDTTISMVGGTGEQT